MKLIAVVASFFVAAGAAHAQETVNAVIGEKTVIPIRVKADATCNVEITIGANKEQRTAEAPAYEIAMEYVAGEPGTTEIRWEGKFRARGLRSTPGCPGSGVIRVTAVPNTEQRRAEWTRLFAGLRAEQQECLKTGFLHKGLRFESIDPKATLEAPGSPASKEVFAKCDTFLATRPVWGSDNASDFACTLRSGEKTRCAGDYAERLPDGRLRVVSKDEAIQLHMDGKAWTTGQRETAQGKLERERLARVEEEKRQAQIVAQRAAEERDRIWKASPEYKKQQAELERQRLAEARAAEEKARKEQEQAELAAKQKREEEEKRRREVAERERQERAEYAKNFPYYAVLSCGFRGDHMNILACFAGRVGTEIELRNGTQYGLYKVHDIGRLGRETREGLRIDLRRNFEIKAQNSNDTLVLGLKIYDRMNNEVVFEKQVARFGVILIKN